MITFILGILTEKKVVSSKRFGIILGICVSLDWTITIVTIKLLTT